MPEFKRSIAVIFATLILLSGVSLYPTNVSSVYAAESRCIPTDGVRVFQIRASTPLFNNSTGDGSLLILPINATVTHAPFLGYMTNGRTPVERRLANGTVHWGWVNSNFLISLSC